MDTRGLLSHIFWCFGAWQCADEGSARHNVEANAPEDEKGPSPCVLLHQQLEQRVEGKGGESYTRQRYSQSQGAPPGEVSHDCGYHGSEDQPPAQT